MLFMSDSGQPEISWHCNFMGLCSRTKLTIKLQLLEICCDYIVLVSPSVAGHVP